MRVNTVETNPEGESGEMSINESWDKIVSCSLIKLGPMAFVDIDVLGYILFCMKSPFDAFLRQILMYMCHVFLRKRTEVVGQLIFDVGD